MNLIAIIVIKVYTLFSRLPISWIYCIFCLTSKLINRINILSVNKVVSQRLSYAFPSKDEPWQRQLKANYYFRTACFAAELVKSLSFNCNEIKQRMKYTNIELLEQLLEQKRYVVCLSGHFVNYEFFTGLPLWINQHYAMLNYYDDSTRSIPYIDNWLKSIRDRFGAISVPISSPLRSISGLYHEIENGNSEYSGFILGALLDIKKKNLKNIFHNMTEQDIHLHYGAEKIGRKIGAAFIYANISIIEKGYYEVTLKKLRPDENGSYMKAYMNELESNILAQPDLWLMWGA